MDNKGILGGDDPHDEHCHAEVHERQTRLVNAFKGEARRHMLGASEQSFMRPDRPNLKLEAV